MTSPPKTPGPESARIGRFLLDRPPAARQTVPRYEGASPGAIRCERFGPSQRAPGLLPVADARRKRPIRVRSDRAVFGSVRMD